MNFITACLLYHSDPYIAFGLLEILLNDYNLRDVYMQDLKGLYTHCSIINALIAAKLPQLYDHFIKHDLKVEMFAADWIISLFSSTMPITRINKFFGMFFKEGWIVSYKVILLIL